VASSAFQPPDALVLGGGGILGEAWMCALLAGVEAATGFDARSCESFVGTSAGSIVAASLAGGARPEERLGRLPEQPQPSGVEGERASVVLTGALRLARGAAALPAAVALRSSAPGGALLRRATLSRVTPGRRSLGGLGAGVERLGVRFDGRLMVAAVDLDSGRRVMFGAAGAPPARVGEAVEASCAIPGFFRPVEIGGRRYVDGGAWSPTNMDALRAGRGKRALCLNPTGSLRPGRASPFGALGALSRAIAGVEALALERRGAHVETVSPDDAARDAMGANLMDSGPREAVIEAGYAQGWAVGRG
jgi:NTE family protein